MTPTRPSQRLACSLPEQLLSIPNSLTQRPNAPKPFTPSNAPPYTSTLGPASSGSQSSCLCQTCVIVRRLFSVTVRPCFRLGSYLPVNKKQHSSWVLKRNISGIGTLCVAVLGLSLQLCALSPMFSTSALRARVSACDVTKTRWQSDCATRFLL